MLKIPSREDAHRLLQNAEETNPGPWVDHSKYAALAAETIAGRHPAIDAGAAYVMGLLHDIGRSAGVTEMRHTVDGYALLKNLGYDDAARICISHSYPVKDPEATLGKYDYTAEELQWLREYLSAVEYDRYDELIQLCDSIALPTGLCLMEKRLVDVAMRYPLTDFSKRRWRAFFEIRRKFESEIGQSIYKDLPGVMENTFGFKP